MKNYVTTYNPLFDRFFLREVNDSNLMRTNIKELKDHYEISVDLPGIKKEDINLSLEDGYLIIKVSYKDETNDEGEYLYHERVSGEFSRSYYVGEEVTNKEIHAKLNEGVLILNVMKVSPKEKEPSMIKID